MVLIIELPVGERMIPATPSNSAARTRAYYFEAESDGRYPIIEAVLPELMARRDNPLYRLQYLLRHCGYLAERRGDCVVLSENAHRLDFRHLAAGGLRWLLAPVQDTGRRFVERLPV